MIFYSEPYVSSKIYKEQFCVVPTHMISFNHLEYLIRYSAREKQSYITLLKFQNILIRQISIFEISAFSFSLI